MKVLFIGGSGVISSASTNLAVCRGIELYHLNRGNSSGIRPVPAEVKQLTADVRNFDQASKALGDLSFDVVVDWISFVPENIENNLKLFKNRTKQYIFISSASAYQTPPIKLPITEETPLENHFWKYSRDKIDCECFLINNAAANGMKYTIVRPSHTYDKTRLIISNGYTVLNRMLKGKPVAVIGDGTSVWTLTHHEDFAVGLVGLLGNQKAMNDDFNITSDEWITWNRIYTLVGRAFGVEPQLVHVPSEIIARYLPHIGDGLLGDKMHSMIFDNSKIKAVVPDFKCRILFEQGVNDIADWYRSDLSEKNIDVAVDQVYDQMIADVEVLGCKC